MKIKTTGSLQLRCAIFTLNNYTSVEEEGLKNDPFFTYICWDHEKGEEGTPHLQGYAEWKSRIRIKKLNKDHFFNRAWLHQRNGTQQQAIAYVMKEESRIEGTKPYERGTPKQGGMSLTFLEMLQEGKTVREIKEEHLAEYLRHHSAVDKVVEDNQPHRDWAMKVRIYYGETGTGKSYTAKDKYPDAYHGSWPRGGRWWWPKYDHEHTVILDEFRQQISYDQMLRLLDRYPMWVEEKGGHKKFNSKRLIITTNIDPTEWYMGVKDRAPLIRRLNDFAKIYDFRIEEDDEYFTYVHTRRKEKIPLPAPNTDYDFTEHIGKGKPWNFSTDPNPGRAQQNVYGYEADARNLHPRTYPIYK